MTPTASKLLSLLNAELTLDDLASLSIADARKCRSLFRHWDMLLSETASAVATVEVLGVLPPEQLAIELADSADYVSTVRGGVLDQ